MPLRARAAHVILGDTWKTSTGRSSQCRVCSTGWRTSLTTQFGKSWIIRAPCGGGLTESLRSPCRASESKRSWAACSVLREEDPTREAPRAWQAWASNVDLCLFSYMYMYGTRHGSTSAMYININILRPRMRRAHGCPSPRRVPCNPPNMTRTRSRDPQGPIGPPRTPPPTPSRPRPPYLDPTHTHPVPYIYVTHAEALVPL